MQPRVSQLEYFIELMKRDRPHSPAFTLVRSPSTDAPPLSTVTESDVEPFLSPSGSVAARARHAHNQKLRASRLPWWKTLGETANAAEAGPAHQQETEVELGRREAAKTE